ncbi:MAG: ROK family protein [Candidatus Omnitrophota bacterium]
MAKQDTKKDVRAFRICPGSEGEQTSLNVFSLLKQGKSMSAKDIKAATGAEKEAVADHVNTLVKKDLLKISGTGIEGLVTFNTEGKKVLGIGFSGEEAILMVMDLAGNIITREHIPVDSFLGWKGRNKEVEALVDTIRKKTGVKGTEISCAGIAVPDEMDAINPRSAAMLAKGIKSLWRCGVFIAKESTAAAYGESSSQKEATVETLLYMHKDIGIGAVVKKEMIFEADEYSDDKRSPYLRPWNQFSVTHTAKKLIDKGVGTDIVNMANGRVGNVTMEIVLKAADKKDELAEDLVKRSGLAMGVRVAYLVNLFNADTVVIGGGTEIREGSFIQHVRESASRFVMKDKVDKLKIVRGVLGKEASSTGAAALCRRELFMTEV